ncbi:Uncharacterized protein Rs2_02843 [Raphanus sativus]|nr:Uncharacterized protein Rs2_02843 [Raphanus sativus]
MNNGSFKMTVATQSASPPSLTNSPVSSSSPTGFVSHLDVSKSIQVIFYVKAGVCVAAGAMEISLCVAHILGSVVVGQENIYQIVSSQALRAGALAFHSTMTQGEDDDKNAAGKRRNLQVLRDIGNVVRRNHTKNNDPAKINHPRTLSRHVPLVELVKHVVRNQRCRG